VPETLEAPTVGDLTGAARETVHVYCECDIDTALCGADVTGHEFVSELPDNGWACYLCHELESQPCPRCETKESITG
jgi:hypothetical protein